MKRLIVFILLVVLFCGINLSMTQGLDFASLFPGSLVEVYMPEAKHIVEFKTVKNGSGQIVFCDTTDLDYILSNYEVNGYTIYIEGVGINQVIRDLSPQSVFIKNGAVYGYKNGVMDAINIKGDGVNFQCHQTESGVCLGFPILLGSY